VNPATRAGRVVVVSGGTFGIGQAITLILARRGYQVVAFGVDAPQPGSTAAGGRCATAHRLKDEGLAADLLEADVSSALDVSRVVGHAVARYGRIDALVNNAAIHPRGNALTTTETMWDRVMAVNLKGAFLAAQAVIPHMIQAGGGAIVNIGSGAGWGKPNLLAYAASKGGVHALTMALAYDHLHHRIRVNCVVPGGTLTGMTTSLAGPHFQQIASRTASGNVTRPEDVAAACAFLLSDDACQISGSMLDVGCFAWQGGPIPDATSRQ
jgi:NAD(P)-dependent dehydrogenase (short-subunit alcohol dehydrogenase family)